LSVLLPLASCALPGGPPIHKLADEVNATLNPLEVVLAPGDVLDVRFPYAPDWTHQVTVGPDGRAQFLALDEIEVAGLLVSQLDKRLTEGYTPLLPKPDLTISVTERAGRMVSILGEVEAPGQFEIPPDGRLSLVEAFSLAGGPSNYTAHMSSTVLVRWDATYQKQRAWKVDARPQYWAKDKMIFLQPYDVIYVPNTPIDKVGIWVEMYIKRLIPFPSSLAGL